jgi:hypothetical protein
VVVLLSFSILSESALAIPKYSGGSGTAGAPYKIGSAADLLYLGTHTGDYGKCFILTADIDMGGQVFATAIIAADTVAGNVRFDGTAFTGMFDGAGHKIINLTINTNGVGNEYLGLFGYLEGGQIKNLGLKDVSITGDSVYLGGLAGDNNGNISNCYSTGTVSGNNSGGVGGLVGGNSCGSISNCYSTATVTGGEDLGGLVGGNCGTISNCYSTGAISGGNNSYSLGGLVGDNIYGGTISNCYSTGSVHGENNSYDLGGLVGLNWGGTISNCCSTGAVASGNLSESLGGLVGWNWGGTISNCCSTGAVTGGDRSYPLGGLIGNNDTGDVNNCYSTGNVIGEDGSQKLGGLVGFNYESIISNCYSTGAVTGGVNSYYLGGLMGYNGGNISNCYSTGAVTGDANSSYLGGLVGESDYYSDVNSCYFIITSGPDNGVGTPLTDEEMKQEAGFVGWDFVGETANGTEDIWSIDEGVSFPKLAWQLPTLPEKAAELAKQVIGADYSWGGKGWDWNAKNFAFVDADTIKAGYTYSWKLAWGKGLDCSGLVFWSYNLSAGSQKYQKDTSPYNPVHYEDANGQYYHNVIHMDKSTPKQGLLPGDLLFFDWNGDNKIDHVVMYVSDFSYPGGTIKGNIYFAGTYDCVNAKGPDWGIIPDTLTNLVGLPGFLGFGRVKVPEVFATASSRCLIDIILTDPDGFTVSKDIPEIPGLLYFSVYDVDENGGPDEMVTIPKRKVGTYLITVVPEPNALPTDTYSLEAIINGQTMILAQDVQIQDIPSQSYKFESISVTKCTVTAGSKVNSDKISFSGTMGASTDDFNDANAVKVTIDSNDIVNPCVLNFPIDANTFKKGKYSYSKTANGVRKSFTYDAKTHKFAFSASNLDLSGLGCPLNVGIEIGNYIGAAEVNETIVNGPRVPIPIQLMTGVKNVLRVDKCTVKQNYKKPNSDQLTVSGGFATANTDPCMAHWTTENLVITLGSQQFTVPKSSLKTGKGQFSCTNAKITEDPNVTASATFNFNSYAFTLTIKNANIPDDVLGDVDFGAAFANFDENEQVTIP